MAKNSVSTPHLSELEGPQGPFSIVALSSFLDSGDIQRLPYIVRILVENVARAVVTGKADQSELDAVLAKARGRTEPRRDVESAASGGDVRTQASGETPAQMEFGFRPARIILQDFTGVPLVTDLAAMRSEAKRKGLDVSRVNPHVPVDLVIDHSVQVDAYGSPAAFAENVRMEMQRNRERYALLKWAQQAFDNFRVVPPASGIVHQVNLEYLARVVTWAEEEGRRWAFPDTVVGTDSHTTMISGIGVLGWGVGGIEAEAAMLGEPIGMLPPIVVGVRLVGELREDVTATDLVLTITERLRQHGVVGKFVEFFGPGLASLTVPDRATVSNMAPEYGATTGFFPADERTLEYLRLTGRDEETVQLAKIYLEAQSLLVEGDDAYNRNFEKVEYDEELEIDLSSIERSVSGPRRPQDRTSLSGVRRTFINALSTTAWVESPRKIELEQDGQRTEFGDGSVVIAAITSCTNTSNPEVMIGAGLLAKRAVERGLSVPPYVKTSLAPGSPVVIDYLERADLLKALESLGFFLVGFGCTTCIGNSGPLRPEISRAIQQNNLVCAAVLSGNRNFEGRIHPLVRLAYLASPPLVVAYAIAGTVDIDLENEPLAYGSDGQPVFLHELWPSRREIRELIASVIDPTEFKSRYSRIFEGSEEWKTIGAPSGATYEWDEKSTYIAEPPFVKEIPEDPLGTDDIEGARILLLLGDSITTDHISPAGSISPDSPAGRWLSSRGVSIENLHSYGARRGNFEVMVRGTFANPRIENKLLELAGENEKPEGGLTVHFPTRHVLPVYDAAMRYRDEGVPLVVVAGKEYGSGSSRDWAAKGTALLGIKAVLAESFERIHRANLVQMGVLPLEFEPGQSAQSVGIRGDEILDIVGIAEGLSPRKKLKVRARRETGEQFEFEVVARVDSHLEVSYMQHGGILPYVIRKAIARR
jgi:aconitate hydratase